MSEIGQYRHHTTVYDPPPAGSGDAVARVWDKDGKLLHQVCADDPGSATAGLMLWMQVNLDLTPEEAKSTERKTKQIPLNRLPKDSGTIPVVVKEIPSEAKPRSDEKPLPPPGFRDE